MWGYISALTKIKQEMTVFEKQIEMAKSIYSDLSDVEMPDSRDIFLLEYLSDTAIEMIETEAKETLDEILSKNSIDELWTAFTEGVLPDGKKMFEYVPVSSWEINDKYFLTDRAGNYFSEKFQLEIANSIEDAFYGDEAAFCRGIYLICVRG